MKLGLFVKPKITKDGKPAPPKTDKESIFINAWGDYIYTDELAGGDILLHEKIDSMPYEEVWLKLLYNLKKQELQNYLEEEKRKK